MIVALDRGLPMPVCAALVLVAVLASGLDSGVEPGAAGSITKTPIGTWIGLVVGLTNGAFYASLAAERGKKCLSIAVRVAGSWIVVISLLMLAFLLRT